VTVTLPPCDLIVWDGQSLANVPDAATAYPAVVHASLTHTDKAVRARNGTTWATRTVNADRRVDPLVRAVNGTRTLIDAGGTSDIDNGMTAAAILADAEAYWTARRSAGFDLIIACTVPPIAGYSAPELAVRSTLNGSILASSVPDAVVDWTAIPELEDPTDTDYFDPDGIHFDANGAAVAGAAILPVYLAALGV
jgi:hypothetical protein